MKTWVKYLLQIIGIGVLKTIEDEQTKTDTKPAK